MPDAWFRHTGGLQVTDATAEQAPDHADDQSSPVDTAGAGCESLHDKVEEFERDLIMRALEIAGGNKAKAARSLRITERIMGLRVRKYGIDPKRFRANRVTESN
jgi:transcriptional regulator with GAF, ATPase, and Fis domain